MYYKRERATITRGILPQISPLSTLTHFLSTITSSPVGLHTHRQTHTHTDTDLFLESAQLFRCGIVQAESLNGHLPVPVSPVDLTHGTTTNQIHDAYVIIGDIPFIHHTVSVLEKKVEEIDKYFRDGYKNLNTTMTVVVTYSVIVDFLATIVIVLLALSLNGGRKIGYQCHPPAIHTHAPPPHAYTCTHTHMPPTHAHTHTHRLAGDKGACS